MRALNYAGTKNRGDCQVDIPHAKRVRKKDRDMYNTSVEEMRKERLSPRHRAREAIVTQMHNCF